MAAVKTKAAKAATHRTKKRSQWRDVWLRLCRNKLAMIAMVVVLLLVLVAIFPMTPSTRLTLCSIPVRSTGWERTTSAVIS